jgi:4-hydroxy-tetrahydrodipicolinate synthase
MKALYPLFGIVTVLNTPFTEQDTIDLLGLQRNVDLAIKSGVAGFLVPAMAAEVNKLSRPERRLMVEAVLDEAAGRIPVIAGGASPDRQQRDQILQDLKQLGCDSVLLQIPYESDTQYRTDVLRAAEYDFKLLMLQDWDFGGGGLPLPLICQLFEEVDAFRCLKIETVPAGIKYSAVLEATDGRLNVSGGWAVMQMLEGLKRGVHAFMPITRPATSSRPNRSFTIFCLCSAFPTSTWIFLSTFSSVCYGDRASMRRHGFANRYYPLMTSTRTKLIG